MTKQLLVDTFDFQVTPQMIQESYQKNNGRLVVSGIVQRADAVNQNHRIYPRQILEREVSKYMTTVNERRALGELDHPCLDKNAQILTIDGWKHINDISDDEVVYTLNINTNAIELQQISKKIVQPYKGWMYKFTGKNIDITATPAHRFLVVDRKGNKIFKTAHELYNMQFDVKNTHLYIPKTGVWNDGIEYDVYTIPALDGNTLAKNIRKDLLNKYTTPLVIDAAVWFSFMGIWLAEGHIGKNDKRGYVHIAQLKAESRLVIKELLSKFPSDIVWTEDKKGFHTSDMRLSSYLTAFGNKYEKYIPMDMKNASISLLENLFEWFQIGDGDCVTYNGYARDRVYSVSKRLVEDLNEVLLKIGGSGKINTQITTTDYIYAGRTIKAENKVPLHILQVNTSNGIYIDFNHMKIEKIEEFDDNIYCVEVPNETFYCRSGYRNSPMWTGNSSATVNLANASHLITNLYWRGNDLIGDMEVLTTPAGNILKELFNCGVKVGISSRALGTVSKTAEGLDLVGEDMDLLTFDVVSNPSTHRAFLSPLHENINSAYNPYDKIEATIVSIFDYLK